MEDNDKNFQFLIVKVDNMYIMTTYIPAQYKNQKKFPQDIFSERLYGRLKWTQSHVGYGGNKQQR